MNRKRLLGVCAVSIFSLLASGAVANAPAIEVPPQNIETGQALLAIETHRAAIINRLLADYAPAMVQRKLDAEILRTSLNALRADQLLAATLVSTLDEVLRVVHEPMPAMGQRYVAISPTEALDLRILPEAQAYLVRDGESLSVMKPTELQLSGRNRVVGYFTADTVTNVITVIQEKPFVKDGPGTGANSWIGYTAGNNQASGTGSAVAAGTSNVASGLNSFVGAGTFNVANGQGAFVGGGTSNVANATSALVMGGFDNRATVIDSLVVAGAGNRATGARSVVVGGGYNLASGQWSFIGGGGRQSGSGGAGASAQDNVAAGDWTTIGGGQGNRATQGYSTVGGGLNNDASGGGATVAGGGGSGITCFDPPTNGNRSCGNTASNFYSSVGGGWANVASAASATVGGGYANTANGNYATVSGGFANIAGDNATVAGGYDNVASGHFTFAAGRSAKAKEDGMFVWADSSSILPFDMTQWRAPGQSAYTFNVRATGIGGVFFATAINPSTGQPTWACYAQNGGGWTCTSDRNVKRNLRPVNSEAMLAKVVAMPVYHWQPKEGPNREVEHLGPMAQDFKAAFGLGDNDKSIGFQDADGVALAAIQGLNAKLEERIAEQQHDIAELRRMLLDLRSTIEIKAAMR